MPTGPLLPAQRTDAESVLHRLAAMPDTRYEELLAVPAEHVLRVLGATSVSLSRWERERGALRCVVNVGELGERERRFPGDQVYDVAEHAEIAHLVSGHGLAFALADPDLSPAAREVLLRLRRGAAISVPLYVEDRLWGELWATQDGERLKPGALDRARSVADEVSGMVALAERLQQMARLAFLDPLTGLGNRRLLDDTLAELLAPDGHGTTVIVCDVNNLKSVNDGYGHDAGDRVIVAVADALAAAASAHVGGVAVRLGGDEFALLLPTAARGEAIEAVEGAARRLAALDHVATEQVRISCGVAVVAAGSSPREALAVADAAQYAAKRRGALLLVASDLELAGADVPRRRALDRPAWSAPSPDTGGATAVAAAVVSLGEGLGEAPASLRGRLGWLAERLLTPFDLDHWTLSGVDLAGDRTLRVASMGLRQGRTTEESRHDLLVDNTFPLADYPASEHAVLHGGWFCVAVDDPDADPGERELLRAMGKEYLLAVGCREGDDGWLLELYGRSAGLDVRLLGATVGLAASALVGRPVLAVHTALSASG